MVQDAEIPKTNRTKIKQKKEVFITINLWKNDSS